MTVANRPIADVDCFIVTVSALLHQAVEANMDMPPGDEGVTVSLAQQASSGAQA